MPALFKVESSDIKDLNALQLTKLLKLLLHLEARSSGIAERAVDVALNITVPDGGEDGRIQWNTGPPHTNYLPIRFVQFQVKATAMGPTDCANEIVNRDGSMKRMVESVLDNGGAYILFTNQELNTEQKIPERIAKIREKLTELGKPYAATATIDIYDAAKIEGWVNNYVSAIVAVLNWVGRPLGPGLKTWNDWSQHGEYLRFPFIADTERQAAFETLKGLLSQPKKCARIIGLSGLGKTRLAFEVFRDAEEHDDLSKRVVYVDASANASILGLVNDWVQCGLEGIVVVDNCEISLHDRIRKEIQRTDSKLSLLTLDYNLEKSSQTATVHLKQLSDEHIKQMLEPVYGKQIPDLDRIVSFAQGFPQMAVLLADARLERELDMGRLTDDELARKMLWGGRDPLERDEKVLKGCALFDRFGLDDEVSVEYKFIAKQIVDVNVDDFYDCVKRFEERGIIDRRGRFARLVPKPLAIRLAAEWWRRTRREKQMEVINSEMPGDLVESFCDQISRLDFLPEVKKLVEDLCGPQGPFGQAEAILSERGSLLFRSLVEVNPEATTRALSSVIYPLHEEELLAIRGDVRRNLVWALEKLCFHETCFEEAANSLLLLASAENESWGNNATGQFKQLFRTFLSGTEASPRLRMKLIDSALSSSRDSVRKLAVEGLEQVIDTYGGSRSVGAEYQGSGEPLKEWRPKVWGEVFEYWDEALRRLCNLVVGRDQLASVAKMSIGRHIRGLMQYGRVDSVDITIRKIVESEGPLWPEALDSIKDSLRYEGDKMPPEGKAKLGDWIRLLTPHNLGDRLKLYVIAPPYEHEERKDGQYIDLAAENAKALATELASNLDSIVPHIDDLLVGEQRMSYWFGKNLVQSAHKWEPLLSQTVGKITRIEKPNVSFFLGILNGIFNLDSSLWEDIVKRLSETEAMIPYYPDIVKSGKVTQKQLDFVVELMAKTKITPISVSTFTYGRSLDHLSIDTLCKFVLKLAAESHAAAWVALDILIMYCYANQERWEQCRQVFREIVVRLPLDRDLRQTQHDMYHWHEVVEKLLISEGEEFAKEISLKIVESSSEKLSFSDLWHYVQPSVRKMFQSYGREVWPVFSEAIKNANPSKRYWLATLLGSEDRFNKRMPSVLAELPDELLREWCFQEPDNAPKFVAEATDVLSETKDGVQISPRARFLIDNFGDDKRVLSALSANMGSFGWTGSLVPYYQRELAALEVLRTHEKANVREWVNHRITYLTKMIEMEKRRDEEHDWGIY
jgi:hypothetical protein